jgi:cobalt-zinc-cadmium efflux system outer membrane protein
MGISSYLKSGVSSLLGKSPSQTPPIPRASREEVLSPPVHGGMKGGSSKLARNTVQVSCCLALLLCLTATALPAQPASDTLLTSYILESLRNHPDIQSMRSMVDAQRSRTEMSRGWMNPELRVGLMNISETFDTHVDPMTMWQIGVMQRLPFPGKLKTSGEANEAKTRASIADVQAAEQDMVAMVTMKYYELAGLLEVRKALQYGQDLTQQMVAASSAMYSSGNGSQADVIGAQVETKDWETRLISNQAEIDRKRADLAYAIGRSTPDGLIDPVMPTNAPSPPPAVDSTMVDTIPTVRSSELQAEAARWEVKRAKLDYWPDLNLMLGYGLRSYVRQMKLDEATGQMKWVHADVDNMVSIELSGSVPLFYRGNQKARIHEMSAMQRSKEEQAQAVRLEKIRLLRDIQAQWTDRLNRLDVVSHSIVPDAELAWQAGLADYQGGKIPFTTLSQARLKLVMSQMNEAMLRADAWALQGEWNAILENTTAEIGNER